VASGGLLALGGDLDGELHTLLQRVARALVDRLHRLNINVGHDQAVRVENKAVTDLLVVVDTKHGNADNLGAVLVERVERHGSDGATHARGDGLARVADKVGHLLSVCLVRA
jgi:hypothetical protein